MYIREALKQKKLRPKFKDFMGEGATISDVNSEFAKSEKLYNYIQALDLYIDQLEDTTSKISQSSPIQGNNVNKGLFYILTMNKKTFDAILSDCKSTSYTSEHHRFDTILGRALRSSEFIEKWSNMVSIDTVSKEEKFDFIQWLTDLTEGKV
jgi:hypothetical protein